MEIAESDQIKNKKNTKTKSTPRQTSNRQGAYNTFPDFIHMGTFINSTHMKL